MRKLMLMFNALLLLCFVNACSADGEQLSEAQPITVYFGVIDDTQTKGTTSDNIYGINVYYDAARDGVSTTHYAYGIFDNTEDMVITLLSGYKYKFECTLVKNGKLSLYCGQYGGNVFSGYAKPFQTTVSPSSQILNSFAYGTTYLSGLQSGEATVKTDSQPGYYDSKMPSVLRYYGEVSGYVPEQGGKVEIKLIKTVFGARFIVNSVPEGKLKASCIMSSNTLLDKTVTSSVYDSGTIVYSYPDVYECWLNEPTLSADVTWQFESSVFDQWNQSDTKSISFKRNKLTTVTVSCTPDNAAGAVSFSEEPLNESQFINLYINSDGLIDIIVNPDSE